MVEWELPYVSSQHDGGGVHDSAVSGIEVMVERGKHHVVPDQATVAQRDTSVVLEMATGVDEHVFANGDVFPEIRIEWRERLNVSSTGRPVRRENSSRNSAWLW